MTEEDKKALAAEIADELQDSAYGIATGADRELTARLVVDRVEHALYQMGWMPPAKTERIFGRVHEWTARTRKQPQDPGPGVLNSHLAELADILHGR
jgi:hypothetical protein